MINKSKIRTSFIIRNNKGLHTRPATELVKCASLFQSDICLIYQGLNVNAKSLFGILMLAANRGAEIEIEAEGIDAEAAIAAIIRLAHAKFNIQY